MDSRANLNRLSSPELRVELKKYEKRRSALLAAIPDLETGTPSLSAQYGGGGAWADLVELRWRIDEIKRELIRRDQPLERGAKRGKPKTHSESAKLRRGTHWYGSSPNVVNRRQIILNNPNFSSKQLCTVFDGRNILLPGGWEENSAVSKWSEAYKKPKLRARIQRIISTDRKEI
jgi:hypothetical protein